MIWPALFLLLAAMCAYMLARAFWIEPNLVEVVHVEVGVPGLDPGLDGVRIAHASDFHVRTDVDKARQVVAAIQSESPDLVCLTGDFVEETAGVRLLAPFLMEMAKGRPAFAVLGNHDHQPAVDVEALVSTFERSGVHVLRNDRAVVTVRGAKIDVVGVDDPYSGLDDLDAAFDRPDRPPSGSERRFVLLLSHSPDIALKERARQADLILCGHTHGGQVRLPVFGPVRTGTKLGRRAAAGLAEIDGARLYVTRGVGESGVRVRYGCRPELSLLTLRRR